MSLKSPFRVSFGRRQAAVRAAVHGRLLVLDGIEKAERNVLPVLNNLLENREMPLEDGRLLVSARRFDQLARVRPSPLVSLFLLLFFCPPLVLPIITWLFYLVLPSSTKFYRVLPSFSEYYRVLPSVTYYYLFVIPRVAWFYLVSSSFTEFYQVLPSNTEFYRVLPIITYLLYLKLPSFT